MKKIILGVLAMAWAMGAGADPTVSNLKVEPISPWKVKLEFSVSGADASWFFFCRGQDKTSGAKVEWTTTAFNAPAGVSGNTACANGSHVVYWDMSADGVALKSTNYVFTVGYTNAMYCIINLSSGSSSTKYPVTHTGEVPSGGFNTDAYKTTNLVLKLCPAGTYKMRNSGNVTLTKPFYMGLFEVTQRQWELVTGSNPSYFRGATLPVEDVSYDKIRGSSAGAGWPATNAVDASSFLGKLRARTGLDFDLPTEAQWEYACRVGTTTTYSYGNSASGDYMWYSSNSSSKTQPVGEKKANPWGLYDMHGNIWEWCLDWYGTLAYGTDPKGSSSGSYRVRRGGSWYNGADDCASSSRGNGPPSYACYNIGFRLARTLP